MVSHRPADNRFYWLSADGISPGCVREDIAKWKPVVAPATVQGRIGADNQIHIHAKNWKRITIWISREMTVIDKPVTILVNTVTKMNAREIKPNLATMLEDFYTRGDRQRLFVAKVELGLTER
jgi:hypothetical protein